MKTQEKVESDEKRLERNAGQRKRYAQQPQLPDKKKAVLLKKKRDRYAASKKTVTGIVSYTDSNVNPQACGASYKQGNACKGITIIDTPRKSNTDLEEKRTQPNIAVDKGKAHIDSDSSFCIDLEEERTPPNTAIDKGKAPIDPDNSFCVGFLPPRSSKLKHFSDATSSKADRSQIEPQQPLTHEYNQQATPSKTRKRTKRNREHEIDNRTRQSEKLESYIVEELVEILKHNPYAAFFRSLADVPNWINHQIIIRSDASLDQRVFNSPSSSQIAGIWLEDRESIERHSLEIIAYNHSGYKHNVESYYGCYDPLQYPLLFPYVETGWHQGIERVGRQKGKMCEGQFLVVPRKMKSDTEVISKERKVLAAATKDQRGVSCREYYCYKLQIRPNDRSILLQAGRLLQQYAVDMYVKLETSRLNYFRLNQNEIRAEVYQGIKDSIAVGETRAHKVGKRIVLPCSFIGGPRDMRKRYLDAMTLVHKYGKPDILLTMTCNPNWSEIKSELQPGEEPQNRPDLAARVFKAKLELLKDDLIRKEVLGPIAAYTCVQGRIHVLTGGDRSPPESF